MDRVASGMPFVFVYLDDIIVGSRDIQSHVQYLRLLFQRLRDHGLVINGEKCEFGVQELDFLGHRVSAPASPPCARRWRRFWLTPTQAACRSSRASWER
jgi:hypothetical protein